jgi:hypothetical protein
MTFEKSFNVAPKTLNLGKKFISLSIEILYDSIDLAIFMALKIDDKVKNKELVKI